MTTVSTKLTWPLWGKLEVKAERASTFVFISSYRALQPSFRNIVLLSSACNKTDTEGVIE